MNEAALEESVEQAAADNKQPLFARIKSCLTPYCSSYNLYNSPDTSATANGWQNRMEILRLIKGHDYGGVK